MHHPAQVLAEAFYRLEELEFFHPHGKFPLQRETVRLLVKRAQVLEPAEFYAFTRELIGTIASYCQNDERSQDVIYRAFNGVDDVLQIDYQETKTMMPAAGASERLYEGGGVGVQTSYSTILKVLAQLRLPEHSHLIDLGSGFGRVGLTTGLWRRDLRFSGYEFVAHRVAASNASAVRAGLAARVQFLQQDLSLPSFEIPTADAYYLYDPFSAATYERVFARLSALGRTRKTTVIAKDGARESFRQSMKAGEWSEPEEVDDGSIHLFHSR